MSVNSPNSLSFIEEPSSIINSSHINGPSFGKEKRELKLNQSQLNTKVGPASYQKN